VLICSDEGYKFVQIDRQFSFKREKVMNLLKTDEADVEELNNQ
jgi:hypothetical protein